MIKILLGGSPCTHWSIAQRADRRETTASGQGWELFRNYLIAKEKFKLDVELKRGNFIMREKRFELKIRKYIDELGGWHVKFMGNAFTKAGTPDLLCCIGSRFVAIEVKAQNGKPSELQIHALDAVHNAGGFAILAYPDMWQELKTLLEAIAEDDAVTASGLYRKFRDVYHKN